MTERDPSAVPGGPAAPPAHFVGLRLRLWIACLAGVVVIALGLWWIAGHELGPDSDPARVLGWLAGIGGLGVAVAGGFALWLDHAIVGHLRGLSQSLASGRVQELRGLPAGAGWGELSELSVITQDVITRQRVTEQAAAELEQLEARLAAITARLERWRSTERWQSLPAEGGRADALVAELNASFARAAEIGEQNLEASRRLREDLGSAADDARESAAQAERGFVEATALLTTVRELQRLAGELRASFAEVGAAGSPGGDERLERYRETVGLALEQLITASNASVEHLGSALLRAQEIASLVQVVSNRATLVALHAATLEARLPSEERRGEDLSRELRQLTSEVREASLRADQLAGEVDRQARAAGERMHALRDHVARQLEPPPAMAASAALPENTPRLLERVREMIQDATQKGERLSSAGERASRAAARLMRRLDEEGQEIDGLIVRLTPSGDELEQSAHDPTAILEPRGSGLRLLDAEADPRVSDAGGSSAERREERP
ncbi:MAG TPA: hypothetical protein VMJ70_11275 [Candidatus Sulfotelmatobacter sp.]|nr:hypothetical protein [Candidatus Sulfotelmatobacter sp.]